MGVWIFLFEIKDIPWEIKKREGADTQSEYWLRSERAAGFEKKGRIARRERKSEKKRKHTLILQRVREPRI